MKLNVAQVERALGQFDAQALPDNHPVVPQLNNLFGDHTFFLDGSGLNVLEPTEAPEVETQTAKIVNLAYWSDADLTKLKPHEPEPTGAVVILDLRLKTGPGATDGGGVRDVRQGANLPIHAPKAIRTRA